MEEFLKLSPGHLSFIGFTITAILGLLMKDLISNVAQGVLFYFDKSFNEGDEVLVNGDKMIIGKIGLRKTVFQSVKDGKVVWLYVMNDRIKFMSLAKIVQGEFEPRDDDK